MLRLGNVGHAAFLVCMMIILNIEIACCKLVGVHDSSEQGRLLQSQSLSKECLDSIQDPSYIGDGYCDSVEGGYNTQGK
jgi:hypothetical protein